MGMRSLWHIIVKSFSGGRWRRRRDYTTYTPTFQACTERTYMYV